MRALNRALLAWVASGIIASALAFLRVLTALQALRAAVAAAVILGFVVVVVPILRRAMLSWLATPSDTEPVTMFDPDAQLQAATTDSDAALQITLLLQDLTAAAQRRAPSSALARASDLLAASQAGTNGGRSVFEPGTLEEVLRALEQSWTTS